MWAGHLLVHHARQAFNKHGRPAFVTMPEATSDAAAATSTIATASASSTVTATSTVGDSPHAEILYPTGQPTINSVDSVEVTYDSVWENVNLTVYCEINQDSDVWAIAELNGSTYNSP